MKRPDNSEKEGKAIERNEKKSVIQLKTEGEGLLIKLLSIN